MWRTSGMFSQPVGREGTEPIEITLPTGRVLRIWPVLAHVEGDMPIREKLTRSLAHGSKHSCFQCLLEGEYLEDAGTVRYDSSLCAL